MKREWLGSMAIVASLGMLARGDAEQDRKDMQGTWLPQSGQLAGKEYPDKILKKLKLVIKDDRYTASVEGEQDDEGTTTLDTGKTPKAMDIKSTNGPNKGKTILAIYELKGDTLRVCYDLSGKGRPADFETKPKTLLFFLEYKREKP